MIADSGNVYRANNATGQWTVSDRRVEEGEVLLPPDMYEASQQNITVVPPAERICVQVSCSRAMQIFFIAVVVLVAVTGVMYFTTAQHNQANVNGIVNEYASDDYGLSVVQGMYRAWSRGDFNRDNYQNYKDHDNYQNYKGYDGDSYNGDFDYQDFNRDNYQAAFDNADKYVTKDFVFQVNYDFKNTDIYKPHYGVAGLVKWCAELTQVSFGGMTAQFTAGPNNTVYHSFVYWPTVIATQKSSNSWMHDILVHTVRDGKVAKIELYIEQPEVIDSLFSRQAPEVDAMRVVQSMFRAWARGQFNGADVGGNTEKYFSDDFQTSSIVGIYGDWDKAAFGDNYNGMDYKDALDNARKFVSDDFELQVNYKFKNTDIYKPHFGAEGFVKWCSELTGLNFGGMTAWFTAGPNGTVYHDFVYTPTVLATNKTYGRDIYNLDTYGLDTYGLVTDKDGRDTYGIKAGHMFTMHDVFVHTVRNGKVQKMELYMGKPQEVDSLFLKADPAMTVVQGMLRAWAKGAFNGPDMTANLLNAEKYFCKDVQTIGNSCYNFRHTDIFDPISNREEIVAQFTKMLAVKFAGMTIQLTPGSHFGLHDGIVYQDSVFTPVAVATNKSASSKMHYTATYTVTDGKICKIEDIHSRPEELDALFGGSPCAIVVQHQQPLTIVKAMFRAWGNGDFNGDDAGVNAQKYFCSDIKVRGNYIFKNTDIWAPVDGLQQLVAMFGKMSGVQYGGMKTNFTQGQDGNVYQESVCTPTAVSTQKTLSHPMRYTGIITVKDNLICEIEAVNRNPAQVDALFAQGDDPLTVVQAMFAAWGRGDFTGADSATNAMVYFSNDFTMRNSYDYKNTDIWDPVNNRQELLNTFKKMLRIKFSDMKVTFTTGPNGIVYQDTISTPTVVSTSVTAPMPMHSTNIFTVKLGKITKLEGFDTNPKDVDALFAPGAHRWG